MKLAGRGCEWLNAERALIYLLMLSLSVKVLLLFSNEIINVDGVRYIEAARHFAEGNFREGLIYERMPFYSLLMVVCHFFVPDWELAGQLISLLSFVFFLVPFYLLTRDIFDRKAAFWAGLALGLSPMLNHFSLQIIRDPIFLFFLGWSLYFFWRAVKKPDSLFFILASVSAVFSLFCRIEGIFLFAVYLLMLLVLAIRNSPDRRSFIKGMAHFVLVPLGLGLMLTVALMLGSDVDVASFSRLGEPAERLQSVFSGDFLAKYRSLYAQIKSFKNAAGSWETGSFAETSRHYLWLIYLLSVADRIAKNLFLFFLLPLLVGFNKRPCLHRGHWLILLTAGTYFLVAYYFLLTHDFIAKRYVLVPTVLLLPWVGVGLEKMWGRLSECRWRKTAIISFLLIFCAAPAYESVDDFTGPGKENVIIEAGRWLVKQPDLQKALIACSDPRMRLYSSLEMNFLRKTEKYHVAKDFRKMEKVAFDHAADLLVIETSKRKRRQMAEFKHFTLLKEFVGTDSDVLIYSRNNKRPASG